MRFNGRTDRPPALPGVDACQAHGRRSPRRGSVQHTPRVGVRSCISPELRQTPAQPALLGGHAAISEACRNSPATSYLAATLYLNRRPTSYATHVLEICFVVGPGLCGNGLGMGPPAHDRTLTLEGPWGTPCDVRQPLLKPCRCDALSVNDWRCAMAAASDFVPSAFSHRMAAAPSRREARTSDRCNTSLGWCRHAAGSCAHRAGSWSVMCVMATAWFRSLLA